MARFTRPPTKFRILRAVTGTGVKEPPATVSFATAQAPQIDLKSCSLMQVLGVDAVPFSFSAVAVPPVVTFPNLPKRDNLVNPLLPLTTARPPLIIAPKDFLLFIALLQAVNAPNGVAVTCTPGALLKSGTLVPGPFLGANTFAAFQAQVAVTAPGNVTGTVSGVVVGMLFLSVG